METTVTRMVDACDCYVDAEDVIKELRAQKIDERVATEAQITTAIMKHMRCMKNLCIECGIDMGECNPRQLCRKTYCEFAMNK